MAETMTKGKSRGATGTSTSGRELPALRVRYWRRMKLQRVYTAEVTWSKSERPPRGEVVVRLIVPGAQVLPSEHALDTARPDDKALFYVTPLAKGRLPEPRLEVLAGERKVQEIPLPAKVVSQRMTWMLLALTFLLPYFYLRYITYSPLNEPVRELMVTSVSDEGSKKGEKISSFKMEWMIKKNADLKHEVETFLKNNIPSTRDFIDSPSVDNTVKEVRSTVAETYKDLVGISANEPYAFYVFVVLLGLTLLSAFLHSAKRRRVVGKPIPAPKLAVVEDDEE